MSDGRLRLEPADPADPDAACLLDRLSQALAVLTGSTGRGSFDPQTVRGEGALFVLARDSDGRAIGCGGYRRLQPGIAELKRMFALPGSRGVGTAILEALERRCAQDGYRALWLETRAVNARALGFYRRHGFSRIPNFGRYVGVAHAMCLGKTLRSA